MSMMRNLFGKANATPKTTPKDAIVRLRENLDMLDKREKYLSQKVEQEVQVAKLNASKNKRS
jgi:charged multivesicular body protein 4